MNYYVLRDSNQQRIQQPATNCQQDFNEIFFLNSK